MRVDSATHRTRILHYLDCLAVKYNFQDPIANEAAGRITRSIECGRDRAEVAYVLSEPAKCPKW